MGGTSPGAFTMEEPPPRDFKHFFYTQCKNAKIYNNILPITLPTKLLYDTTKTLPGGAICHDYPLAFNINLKKEKKIHLNIPLNTKC